MNIEQLSDGRYRLRWYVAGRGSPRRQKTFPRGTRRNQVEAFAANLEIRRAMGELALYEQRKRPVRDLSKEWWAKHAVPNLAEWTRIGYKRMLVKHIEPRLGSLPVGEVNPEIVADFRAKLEAAAVGRHSVRQSLQCAATCGNTCSLTESAKGCSSRAETASLGGCTTTRTGADGRGTRREPRLGSRPCRPMTCGTLSPRFRSELACRSRSSPSRWATHLR